MPTLVFDLGGTHLRCGVAYGAAVHGIAKQRIETFLGGLTPEDIAGKICSRIESYIARTTLVGPQDPIVLAFPGPIQKRRFAISAPTLYGDANRNLPDVAGELHKRTGRDVHVLNDVSAAAWRLSARADVSRFMVVTVSSGIGSKLFDRTNPLGVLDDPPFAGEIGHYVVDLSPEAIRCDCGGLGHLGGIASGRGVERLARRLHNNENLTNEHEIVPAIQRKEAWATDVLRIATEPLARTLLAVTMAIGLDKIFVIGGFAQHIGPLYGALLSELILAHSRYQVLEGSFDNLVELVGPDEELCLSGAAFYASTIGLDA